MSGWGQGDGTSGAPPPPPPPPPIPPPPPGAGQPPSRGPWDGRRAGIIPLHPMSLGDVLDTAFKLFRATAGAVMLTVAIVYGPLSLLTSLPGATMTFEDPADPFGGMSTTSVAIAGLAVLITALVGPLVSAAVMTIAIERERGVTVSWSDAYRTAWSRFGTLLLATLLLFLISIGVVLAIAIPAVAIGFANEVAGVIVAVLLILPAMAAIVVLFYVVVPVVLLEDVGAAAAVRRSVALVRPRFWPTLGTIIVAGIIIGIIGTIVSLVFTMGSALAGSMGFVLNAIGSTAGSLLTVPLTANVALLVYLDARIRHEGLDIEVLTADLARDH